MLKPSRLPEQTESLPDNTGVVSERTIFTDSEAGELCPHPLIALTMMLPPLVLVVTLIVFVVLVPVQPEGNVH